MVQSQKLPKEEGSKGGANDGTESVSERRMFQRQGCLGSESGFEGSEYATSVAESVSERGGMVSWRRVSFLKKRDPKVVPTMVQSRFLKKYCTEDR